MLFALIKRQYSKMKRQLSFQKHFIITCLDQLKVFVKLSFLLEIILQSRLVR